ISDETTLVFILEDLHWVDHSTVDLISAIARGREQAKLLLVSTFRPADLILFESPFKTLKQDLLLHHLATEVLLERLNEEDVAAYLLAEFAEADLPAGLSKIIHRHSDGNGRGCNSYSGDRFEKGAISNSPGIAKSYQFAPEYPRSLPRSGLRIDAGILGNSS